MVQLDLTSHGALSLQIRLWSAHVAKLDSIPIMNVWKILPTVRHVKASDVCDMYSSLMHCEELLYGS